MSRYSGAIGIKNQSVETDGIVDTTIEEIPVTGTIYKKAMSWSVGEASQNKLQSNQTISVIAPESVQNRLDGIVYATYLDIKWSIKSMEYIRPRLRLTIGGTYNAP